MSIAISYLSNNGTIEAFVIGSPQWRASGKSRAEAEARLQSQLQERLRIGELKFLDLREAYSFVEAARTMSEEERELCREVADEIRREREAERAAELAE